MKNVIKKIKKEYAIGLCVILSIGLVFCAFFTFFIIGKSSGTSSMDPTLEDKKAYFELKKEFTDIERLDIVSLYNPEDNKDYIKRIVGLPGDHIVVDDFNIYVNGEKLDEPYIADVENKDFKVVYKYQDIVLGEEEYFVCGDNRRGSHDSRSFGPVKYKNIKGKLLFAI